jgi:dipeptidyl aminopeptidase/acylaminoacyl peptidase
MLRSCVLFPLVLLVACAGGAGEPARPAPRSASPARPSVRASAGVGEATSEPTKLTPQQVARDAELLPRARAVLDAFGNGAAYVTRTGTLVFMSNRDGLAQVYVSDLARPKDPPRRLPTPQERIVGVTPTADERSVLFASDVGGDGNFRIFRVGLDGTGLTELTSGGAMHRDPPIIALKNPEVFAYSGHAPASEKTEVFVQSLGLGARAAPRSIHVDERGGALVDLSPDGKRALFARYNSDQDVVVFEVDTSTATATASRIFPPEGQPAQVNAAYSANGDLVYAATHLEGSHATLLALDPKTRRTTARYEETTLPNGTIAGIVPSPVGDRVAIQVDGGNHAEVRLLNARTLKLERTIEVPLGGVGLSSFTRDGKGLTLSQSQPDGPSDVYLANTSTGRVTPLRDDDRPGLPALPRIKASIETIKAKDGLDLPTNLYLPAQVSGQGSRLPVLVSIHGGPSGSAYVEWNAYTKFFVSLGYAVVEPNIRGSTGFGVAFEKADNKEKRADAVADVEAINRWTRAQPWCDPDRVVIMGQSYGGYMTLLALARQPGLWRAGIDLSGMSDLRTMEKLEDQAIRVFDETEFGVLGKEDDLLFEWSPLKYVDRIAAPVFIYQGARDPITPQNEADQMVMALRKRAIPVEYMLLANEGHGVMRGENKAEYLARAARFLEEHASSRATR